MVVGLFVPCYVNQFYPTAAIATLQVLERLGITVVVPSSQTCCGQPMANAGFEHISGGCLDHFKTDFADMDYVVCPSGSCTLHIKEHLNLPSHHAKAQSLKLYELVEFLTDVLEVKQLSARFNHKVGLHQSCHGLRGLHLSQMSELKLPPFSKPEHLLRMVDGLQLVGLDRQDDCCGFGGMFCVTEETVSVKMGKSRVLDHLLNHAEYITSTDLSCLMHLEGIARRNRYPLKIVHIAEILNAIEP